MNEDHGKSDGGGGGAGPSRDGDRDRPGDGHAPVAGSSGPDDRVHDDDPHKVEKLTRAGRSIDPDAGSD